MTATTIRVQMAQRKDTAAGWTAANPILLLGEIGYETDAKKFKIGDGSTNWNSLAYLPIPDGSGNLTITGNLEIGSTGSLTFEGSTADGFETTLAVTDPTADRTITLPDVTGTVVTTGDTGSVTSTMLADGSIVNADINASAEIAVSKLANGTANQVLVTDGTDVSWSDNLTLAGDLTVNGTTTTINTQDLLVEDKNIIIGNVDTPSDVTADGGGITLKGSTDKTINWIDATDAWTLSENVNIASGKEYRIDGTKVLDATSLGSAVVSSSLTSVGTIGSGTWQGTAIDAAYLDSTIVTTGDTGTVTSTMIADGTIVDSDVNASAAIAGTKISPNFGSQNVTTTGTATAAALIPSGSSVPTNGVYLPSSNNVAISTNGTGRLFVDASGRVGIGTSNQNFPLSIQTDSSAQSISLFGRATDDISEIKFFENDRTTVLGELQYRQDQLNFRHRVGYMSFSTGGVSERMRLTADGKLGLGTSSPDTNLEIALSGSSANGLLLSSDDADISPRLFFQNATAGEGYAILQENGGLNFRSGATAGTSSGTQRVRIDSSGRVGIGTTSPGAQLEISNTGNVRIYADAAGGYIEQTASNLDALHLISSGLVKYQSDPQNDTTETGHIFECDGSEKARIDSSGRLLVGTTSGRTVSGIDATIFNEGTSGGASSIALVRNSDNTGSPFVLFAKSRGTSNGSNTIVQTDDVLGGVAFAGADGTDIQTLGALIEAKVDGTPGANDMPGRLVFATTADGASSPTERMRIGSDGFVRIGSPSPAVDAFLNVECNTSTAAIESSVDGGGVTLRTHISFSNSNGTVGSITTTGSATAYNTSSDYRLKENVVPLTGAADRLNQLQVHRFNFIADPDKTVDGFIAHEAQAVVPECVTGTKDEVDADGNPVYQGIDQSKLVPLLTAALQEAMERIETLEAEVQQLKGQ
jgi:hypothetical protein